MQNKVKRNLFLLLIILAVASAILACGIENSAEATAQVINEVFSKTATAAASADDGADRALLTAQVEATEQAQIIEVTQTAISEVNSKAQQATAAAEVPVLGELTLYGVDTEKGHVAWMHPPTTLEANGYMAFDYANDYPEVIAKDFVISAEITWNTEYGSSGCGYMLRSNGDQNKPDQYMAMITRGGNGHLVFAIMEDGQPVGGYDIFPRTNDKSFDADNGTTNRVAVMGQGGVFTFFTNGTWVGEIDLNEPPPKPVLPPIPQIPDDPTDNDLMEQYRKKLKEYEELIQEINDNYKALLTRYEQKSPIFEEGFVGFALISESGETTCDFENAWLWIIEE